MFYKGVEQWLHSLVAQRYLHLVTFNTESV